MSQAAHSRRLLTVVAIVADVAAVVALFAVDSRTIILMAAALALLAGTYVLVRGWGATFDRRALLGVAGVVAGAATLSAVLVPRPATPDIPDIPPAPPGSASAGGGGAPMQVRLDQGDAVDLDSAAASVDADGPNGNLDLYLGLGSVGNELRANNSDFTPDTGTEADARERCGRTRPVDTPEAKLYADLLDPGEQFCFRTSDRNVAWARVNDRTGEYLVLNVTVWS